MFKKNENLATNDLERDLFETRKKIEKIARESQLKEFYICSFTLDLSFTRYVFSRNAFGILS